MILPYNYSFYLAFLLICIIVALDFIPTFQQPWFVYITFIVMFLSLLVWNDHPGIPILLVILFLQSAKYSKNDKRYITPSDLTQK